ncbi:PREDICTED: protein lin-54 homolog [Nicrophorus vespilloides]|uniref:Protein lin-54 homolog n=1 Tax=Nicrophorus vespilloides TaxID=110193 RepID=A0ABM1MFU0_NICVS|nr:PREDICTED: protein lin-54 homolog [Nicrophorus vespilloides]
MSFVQKDDSEATVESIVQNITIDGDSLNHSNLTSELEVFSEDLQDYEHGEVELETQTNLPSGYSYVLSTSAVGNDDEEIAVIESEEMGELLHKEEEKIQIEIKSKSTVPPLRPLSIAPKPAKVPLSFKTLPGQQLLVVQGAAPGQQIKLLSTSQGISLANLQMAKPVTMKTGTSKVATSTISVVQPKQLVMKKVISQVPKPAKTFEAKAGQQIVLVQKSEPQAQLKIIQTPVSTTTTATKTLTLAQAQQMGLISGTKIIPQGGGKQIILNKGQTSKPIKIVPQVRSPTKILPAPQTSVAAGKLTQRIYIKPTNVSSTTTVIPSQIIQVAGTQAIAGGLHQINIPGKGMQYIKFITPSQAETTTVASIQTTKAPALGTKVIPITTTGNLLKNANLVLSELKTISKTATISQKLKTTTTVRPVGTLSSSSTQMLLPTYTRPQATLKVAIPSMRNIATTTKSSASTSTGDAIVPNIKQETPMETNGMRPRKPCNCTKSQCLKLYCDCFANGEFCYMCNCMNCYNNLDFEEHRQRAIKNCLERNPNAFRPKIGKAKDTTDGAIRKHTKGCNCKRSGCLKNYCECYEAKIPCSGICKCIGCRNFEDTMEKSSSRSSILSDSSYAASPKRSLSYSNRTKKSPVIKHAFNYVTTEVIEATTQCLLTLCNNAEECDQEEDLTTKQILDEFGRCLKQIIDCSISKSP